jgi:hypothetical protein
VRFKEKFEQGDVVFSERRSLIFKRMRIVRGCDAKRNTLVYMVYSDRRSRAAQELDLERADHALGRGGRAAEMRRLGEGLGEAPAARPLTARATRRLPGSCARSEQVRQRQPEHVHAIILRRRRRRARGR